MKPGAIPELLERDVFLVVLRAAESLLEGLRELLRGHGLSPASYNVLRILRGAGRPLTCGEIGARLLQRGPDVTRLVDRLLEKGLVERRRNEADRRVVEVVITRGGRELLRRLDAPVDRLHVEQFAHLSRPRLRELSRLLAAIAGPDEELEATP